MSDRDHQNAPVIKAIIWTAAFLWAVGIFTSTRKFIDLDPPDTSIVGAVTLQNASKAEDYARATFFFVGVPLMTVGLAPVLRRYLELSARRSPRVTDALLFATPFALSALVYLLTRKELWSVLVVPLVAGIAARVSASSRSSLDSSATALLISSSLALVVARYLLLGRWIANIESLILETSVIVIFTVLVIWSARLLARTVDPELTLRRYRQIAIGSTPSILAPVFGLAGSAIGVIATIALALVLTALLILRDPDLPSSASRRIAAVTTPILIFATIYATIASPSDWVDLFHRGETLGPASDYLAGQIPYRDVVPLHGLLEDGLLDTLLMSVFGRSQEVAFVRAQALTALMLPLLWILGFQIFRSWSLATITTLLSMIVAADNQRSVLVLLTVIALIAGFSKRRPGLFFFAGLASILALFFSIDTGVYSLAGSAAAVIGVTLLSPDCSARFAGRASAWYLAGASAGALPFAIYLASNDVLGAFLHTTFVLVPSVIDEVWSLPYPDIGAWFATNAGRASLFEIARQFRYLFGPSVIAIALVWIVARFRHRRNPLSRGQLAIVVIAPIATLAQRSALGRADFNHQWFAAFLIAPLLILLVKELMSSLSQSRLWSSRENRAAIVASLALGAALLLLVLWSPGLIRNRLDAAVDYRDRVEGRATDQAGDESRLRISEVTGAIRKLAPPDNPIFDFSNQPAFYFYADRRNPTRFYQIPLMSRLDLQSEAIDDLEADPPAVILMTAPDRQNRFDGIANERRAALVADWIHEHYELDHVVRGVELWIPSESPTWIEGDPIPLDTISNGETELVVPFITAGAGADGEKWSTDLLIINRETDRAANLVLDLVSSDHRLRTTVRIDPDDQRMFHDLAGSLFGRPGDAGALFVRIEPSSRVGVFTRARNAQRRSSWNRALEFGDRSGGHIDFPGLTPSPGQRVNVAVANVGHGGATVDFYLDGDGSDQGYRFTIPERESAFATGIDDHLGGRPSERRILRAYVSEGVVAATATVYDPRTGHSETVLGVPRAD